MSRRDPDRSTAYHAPSASDHERALLARVALRESAAFQELYFIYHRRLARFLTRFVHRYDIAEEVINDTMWVVWSKACDFRDASRVSTWIMGIAYRRALKVYNVCVPSHRTRTLALRFRNSRLKSLSAPTSS